MKLRIRGNSIRLRLAKGEVDRFEAGGMVEEKLVLGPDGEGLTYRLQMSQNGPEFTVKLENSGLIVSVPERAAREWAGSDEISIGNGEAGMPRILVEKDFACLSSRPGEDESDMYPNPGGAACT